MSVHLHGGYEAYQRRRSAAEALRKPTLSETLRELGRIRQAERESTRVDFLDWALRVPEPKTGTLDFSRFPPQRELYAEAAEDREAVVKKGTQVGVSAFALRWAMYWADTRGWSGLYVFPRLAQMYDFSDARIRTVVLASPYLRERVPGAHVQNKGLKQIGLGFVYFRGSESKEALDSVDADHLVFDEYDTLRQDNIPDAEQRITGSRHGLIRRIGVPSIPGRGIAELYEKSDQRRWNVRCDGCGEWQDIDFWKNVDQKRLLRVCRSCARPLDVAAGEWVAAYPDRDVRGYHFTRLILPDTDLGAIVKASRKKRPFERQTFHNKDLGLEYAPEEGRLSDAALAAAQSAGQGYTQGPADLGYVGPDLVTAGVDVASSRDLNVRISRHLDERRKLALFIGRVSSFDELAAMLDRYGVKMAAIDHLPEGRLARGVAERFRGRVYVAAFNTSPHPRTADVMTVDDEQMFASVRRVELLDATLEMVRGQRNLLPLDWPEDYAREMQSVQRVVEEDELGRKVVRYLSSGPDDYAMAEAYDVLATELWWRRQALDEAQRETFQPLDRMLEFQRSELGDYEADGEYIEGPDEGDADEF